MLRRFRCAGSVLQTTSGGERLIIRTKLPPAVGDGCTLRRKNPSIPRFFFLVLMCDFNEVEFSHGTGCVSDRQLV